MARLSLLCVVFAMFSFLPPAPCSAKSFYVDPAVGSMKVVFSSKHPARQRFIGTYSGGGLLVQLPAKNGSLGVFDLQGRVVAAVTCSGEDRVRIPLTNVAGQCLIMRFQSGGKGYYIHLSPRL